MATVSEYYQALATNTYTIEQLQAVIDAKEDPTIKAIQQDHLNQAIAQFNVDNSAAPGASNPANPQISPPPPPAKSNTLLYVGIAAVVAYLAFKG
jgi:hypothetical protein